MTGSDGADYGGQERFTCYHDNQNVYESKGQAFCVFMNQETHGSENREMRFLTLQELQCIDLFALLDDAETVVIPFA